MKKMISVVLSLALLFTAAGVFALQASAVTYISDENFDYAVGSDDTYLLFRYKGNADSLELPTQYNGKSIEGIMSYCFNGKTLSSVTIPEGYSSIGELAFYNCTNLAEITLPSSVTAIGDMAFAGCSSLTKLDMSDATSLEAVPFSICFGDSGLNEVVLSDGIVSIEETAFKNTGLTSVALGKNIKSIGGGAFQGCTNLENVYLNKGLESIGARAFYGDTSLKKLYIPSSVNSIGEDAFAPMTDNDELNIFVYLNSYAQRFFIDNNITAYIIGDCDFNEDVDINDATCLQRALIGLGDIRIPGIADVNRDGDTSIRDVTLIQMYVAQIIDNFEEIISD